MNNDVVEVVDDDLDDDVDGDLDDELNGDVDGTSGSYVLWRRTVVTSVNDARRRN